MHKKKSCVYLFLMLYPDLNKNSGMWYDCKIHLSTENNYKISPADK